MPKLSIQKIDISRAPGFPRGMNLPEQLGANINIIAGANGTGKSTMARGIQTAVWRTSAKGNEVNCLASIDADTWEFRVGPYGAQLLQNGVPGELPLPITPNLQEQYLLSLETLLSEKANTIASTIARQSIGGYDIDACVKSLNYEAINKNKNCPEYVQLSSLKEAVEEEQKKHMAVKHDEEKLEDLRKEKQQAEEASAIKDVLEKRLSVLREQFARDQAKHKLDELPTVLSELDANMGDRLDKLVKRVEDLAIEIQQNTEKQNSVQKLLDRFLVQQPLEPYEVEALVSKKKEIIRLTQLIASLDDRIQHAESLYQQSLVMLNASDGFKITDVTLPESGAAEKIYVGLLKCQQELERLEGEITFQQQRLTAQQSFIEGDLEGGIFLLSEWLKNGDQQKKLPLRFIVGMAVFALISFALYFIASKLAAGLVLIIPVIAGVAYVRYYTKAEGSSRQQTESQYAAKGLVLPKAWTSKDVSDLLTMFIDSKHSKQTKQDVEKEIARLGITQQELSTKKTTLDQARKAFEEGLGVQLPTTDSLTGLLQYVHHLEASRKAWNDWKEYEHKKKEQDQQLQDLILMINETFSAYSIRRINDLDALMACIDQIQREESTRSSIQKDLAEAKQRIIQKTDEKIGVEKDIAAIYRSADLEIGDRSGLALLLRNVNVYKQLSDTFNVRELSYQQAYTRFQQDPYASKYRVYWEEKEEAELMEKIEYFHAKSLALSNIGEAIARIEAEVNSKKSDHKLENLLAQKEKSTHVLADLFDRCKTSIAGNVVGAVLKKEVDKAFRPAVIEQADHYFSQFTSGRYSLLAAALEGSTFILTDNETGSSLSIQELSAGTRIQLLLAVKIAFIERMETGVAYPLLIDEALVSSDSIRSTEIMDTLKMISKDRQIFYFTCRPDEVSRWKKIGEAEPNLVVIHELSSKRGNLVTTETYPIPELPRVELRPSMSDQEVVELLKLDKPDLAYYNVQSLPLWFLLNDKRDVLQALLNAGVTRWGQLESLMNKGLLQPGLDEVMCNALRNSTKGLEHYIQLFSQGVSKSVDGGFFENLVKRSSKLPEVINVARETADAKSFIQKLKNKAVPGLQAVFINELEEALIEQGYISQMDSMSEEQIKEQLVEFCMLNGVEVDTVIGVIERINGMGRGYNISKD